MIDKGLRFLTREHGLIGLSVVRIFFGIAILYELLVNWSTRHLLWGPNGLYSYGDYKEYVSSQGIVTLFDLSNAPWMVDAVFIGGIIVALAYILGYRTRLAGVLLLILFWSLYFRNVYITHGGDNIMRLQLTYLVFANMGAYFSLDARGKRKKGNKESWLASKPILQDCAAIFHNFAWMAAMVQLAFMYFASGTYKVMGSMWQNGSALYYATRVQEFYTPGLSDLLWQSETFLVLMAHMTVIYQVAFPFLLLNRYTKYIALLTAFTFHTGIAVVMGLYDFSWIMIGCEFLLLTDKDYRALDQGWSRFTLWAGSKFKKKQKYALKGDHA
ncbi:HTTM domain-containing protein [Paenactinomyces guangxiensis]|uniref:HTTM domain-containing protein n=1 Tax=Paenactinomyces guangxiensis TaxID=1490290 RepID=A0A7W1WTI5_9BACL|nr:HTTM domain-containing protein [Paenactinomyces guangxiensis]MBA4495780.1 HTTM domain-containing protein [Paenactinomyces guangxiensis]MBH8592870.1 HTTM domain-containing protein [Paenactinomyces guangxiensis]